MSVAYADRKTDANGNSRQRTLGLSNSCSAHTTGISRFAVASSPVLQHPGRLSNAQSIGSGYEWPGLEACLALLPTAQLQPSSILVKDGATIAQDVLQGPQKFRIESLLWGPLSAYLSTRKKFHEKVDYSYYCFIIAFTIGTLNYSLATFADVAYSAEKAVPRSRVDEPQSSLVRLHIYISKISAALKTAFALFSTHS